MRSQLLEDDSVLQETKSQNSRLLEYLSSPETLNKLIEYVITEPQETEDPGTRFKYVDVFCKSKISRGLAYMFDAGQVPRSFCYRTVILLPQIPQPGVRDIVF